MKKIYNVRVLLMACIATVMGFLTSCDNDDEDSNNGQIALLSFGPTGVQHGETIKFIGENLDQVTSIVLPGVEVSKEQFSSVSSTVIELVVPAAAERGKVILKTPQGDIESKTEISFDVPIVITSVTAEAKPGTNVTITGEYLNWVESVTFADDLVVTEFVSQSLNELVVTVPMEAKTGRLIIWSGGTEPLETITDEDLIVTLPTVSALAPNPIERGSELTITGTDLDLVQKVLFKGDVEVTRDQFVNSDVNQIVLLFPEEANKGSITLVTYSAIEVTSEQELAVEGDLPPLAPLALAFYTDALANGWQKWGGWGGGSADVDNSDNVRDGTRSVKVVFAGGWGGPFQIGGGNSSTTGYTEFAISIFGTAGTNGKQVNLVVKNGGAATEKIITIVEGEWTEYKFSIASDLGGIATITELFLQDRDWSGTLYVDHIGLR